MPICTYGEQKNRKCIEPTMARTKVGSNGCGSGTPRRGRKKGLKKDRKGGQEEKKRGRGGR